MLGDITNDPVSADFTGDDLQRIRAMVQDCAIRGGLPAGRTADLVTAVNEFVINAVLHAGGGGSITASTTAAGVSIEISDGGPGMPEAWARRELPPPQSIGGRGIWIARRLFPDLQIVSSAAGVTITVVATRP